MLDHDVRSPRAHRSLARLCVAAAIACAAASLLSAGAVRVSAQSSTSAAPPSAIGNEAVVWIAVSPAYTRTGTVVVASASLSGCPQGSTDCSHIWVSHDGGHSWSRAKAQGWNGIRPQVAVDGAGREVLYGTASPKLLRSTDFGNTWTPVGPSGGAPTPAPTYSTDQALAVAGKTDYILRGSQSQTVSGSNGAMSDGRFAYSPSYPSGGANPPALLGGIDAKSGVPSVQHCDAALSCTGTVALNGSTSSGVAPNLYLSTGFGGDGTVFAQTPAGIFKSTNGGGSFSPLAVGAPGATSTATAMMALAPGYREQGPVRTAYAAVFQATGTGATAKRSGGVFRSTDGGATWNALGGSAAMSDGVLAVAVAPDRRLFAGYLTSHNQGGLLCSSDDGATWQAACPPVGGVGGSSSTGGGSAANAAGCNGAGCATGAPPPSSSSTRRLLATGPGTAPSAVGGGPSTTPNRLWLIPLILAAALAVAAGVATAVRRRAATDRG